MTGPAHRSPRPPGYWRLGLLALACAACLSAGEAQADPPETTTPESAALSLPEVTVEAQREREQLRRKVDTYVSAALVHPSDESMSRWDMPICLLVAGLPADRGEFILTRVSAIAAQAGAPLDKNAGCHANFFVVVTATPDVLLKKWRARDPAMFNTTRGAGGIDTFLRSSRPVRVWYNADWGGSTGASPLSMIGGVSASSTINNAPTTQNYDGGSRLKWSGVRQIESVLVVVDTTRLKDARIGALADYVAMVGLADVRLDADYGPAPTILRLFSNSQTDRADALSDWDQALLRALYTTNQQSQMQLSEMRTSVMKTLSP